MRRLGLLAGVAVVLIAAPALTLAAGSGAFISPAGQGSVIGVTNRISYITPAFDPVDGERVSWSFNVGTVSAHRTGAICDGAHVADGGTAPTDGNSSYPGFQPSSGSTHGPLTLPNGAASCRLYMFHASGYGSNVHNGGLYEYAPEATPTPTPAPSSGGGGTFDDTAMLAQLASVEESIDLGVFAVVFVGAIASLTAAWIAVAGLRR